ncbi:hypothetical protein WG904_08165 [Pedobacter sp. Du54]|uniref:hypothetical protein n=1 Tax=Pedobacter anseongensis TaxID=3133439 RepID=UPI0030A2C411
MSAVRYSSNSAQLNSYSMFNDSHLSSLKLKLASYGAIRQQAWTKILSHLLETELKTDESFDRKINAIVYVTNGLIKEYETQQRKKPSIVNFINTGNFIITTKHNQTKYLKAIDTTKLIYLDFEALVSLFITYNELKSVYDGVLANYEDGIAFRQLVLEENVASARIKLFIDKHRTILPSLKKKDIANYIHVDYDYFIRIYGKLL